MTIFSPAFCSALVRACTKQHISSYRRSRESKKVSTKTAGSPPDWLSAPASQSQSATHPLPLLYLHYEEQRAWDCVVHTPAGCRSEQNPRAVYTVWLCGPIILQNQNSLQVHSYKHLPLLHLLALPEDPLCKTITSPQPHINIHMKVWRRLNRTVISLKMRLTESDA